MNKDYENLCNIAEMIADMFSTYCQTAVYQIKEKKSELVKIFHPKVTNQNVGDSIENFPDLENPEIKEGIVDHFYDGINENCTELYTLSGKVLKFSTIHYKNKEHYVLAVIFDKTVFEMAEFALSAFNKVKDDQEPVQEEEQKLEEIFESCHKDIGIPIYSMQKKERVELVKALREKNIFAFQKSIPFVAGKLHVSRYSIYNYLREIEMEEADA